MMTPGTRKARKDFDKTRMHDFELIGSLAENQEIHVR